MSIYHAENPNYTLLLFIWEHHIFQIDITKPYCPMMSFVVSSLTNYASNIQMISMLNTQMVVFSFYYPYFHIEGLTLKFMCLGSNTKTHKMKPPCIYSSIILSVCMKVLLCVNHNDKKFFPVFFKFLLNTS